MRELLSDLPVCDVGSCYSSSRGHAGGVATQVEQQLGHQDRNHIATQDMCSCLTCFLLCKLLLNPNVTNVVDYTSAGTLLTVL